MKGRAYPHPYVNAFSTNFFAQLATGILLRNSQPEQEWGWRSPRALLKHTTVRFGSKAAQTVKEHTLYLHCQPVMKTPRTRAIIRCLRLRSYDQCIRRGERAKCKAPRAKC